MTKTLTILLALFTAGHARAAEITVFAAASLTDALRQIASDYAKTSGDTVNFNFAASNTLAQQIKAGAPADLFFSADAAMMDSLDKDGLVTKSTRKNLLGNSLVIITPMSGLKISAPSDLRNAAIKHLSIGNPKAVPAGVYAKAWLEKSGLWTTLEPKVAPAENVRAALAVVESGNAEVGIVYKTDAAISKKITIAYEIPATDGPKITYPAAVLSDSRNPSTARAFLAHLSGEAATRSFLKFGFSVTR
ncbi:MAG: molybdate ABC transporter substrate-binding protein [Verrucomicrobiota bacterium]